MRVALFEPEIAGNVGAVLRLGACLGAVVDLVEPMGFEWDDRRVRRTAMDYIDHVTVVRHVGFDAFRARIGAARLVLFTTKAGSSAYDFRFAADDVLLFGKESAGRASRRRPRLRRPGAAAHAATGPFDEPRDVGGPRSGRGLAPNRDPAGLTTGRPDGDKPMTEWDSAAVRAWLAGRIAAARADQVAAERYGRARQDDCDIAAAEEMVCTLLKGSDAANAQQSFADELKALLLD